MMFFKNLLANLFYYPGTGLVLIGSWLHVKFKTPTGMRLSLINYFSDKFKEALKDTSSATSKQGGMFYVKDDSEN